MEQMARSWRSLQLHCEVNFRVTIHGNSLPDARFRTVGLRMRCFDGVLPVRDTGNPERAILAGHCEVRVINDTNIGEHPRMHIALEANHHLRAEETLLAFLTFAHLPEIEFLVFARSEEHTSELQSHSFLSY